MLKYDNIVLLVNIPRSNIKIVIDLDNSNTWLTFKKVDKLSI